MTDASGPANTVTTLRGASPSPSDVDVRLECLRLSCRGDHPSAESVVAAAQAFYTFVTSPNLTLSVRPAGEA